MKEFNYYTLPSIIHDQYINKPDGVSFRFKGSYLLLFGKLRASTQQLLYNLCMSIPRRSKDVMDLILKDDYALYGYSDRRNYHRDKKLLEKDRFIEIYSNGIFINPFAIDAYSNGQYEVLVTLAGRPDHKRYKK